MATPEERRKILEMVAEGKISATEAADLLGSVSSETQPEPAPQTIKVEEQEAAMAEEKQTPVPAEGKPAVAGEGGRWLRIQVEDVRSGQRKVQVSIPLSLVNFGLNIGRNFAPELEDVDWTHLGASLRPGERNVLVDVQDEEDGEHVQIYVE